MNFLIFLVFFAVGLAPLIRRIVKAVRSEEKASEKVFVGPALWLIFVLFVFIIWMTIGMPILTESMWFDNLGFSSRFWMEKKASWGLFGIFFLISMIWFWANNRIAFRRFTGAIDEKITKLKWKEEKEEEFRFDEPTYAKEREDLKQRKEGSSAVYFLLSIVVFVVAFFGMGSLGKSMWAKVLLFFNQVSTGVTEPMFHNDVSFYLFSLPFWHAISSFLLLIVFLSMIWILLAWAIGETNFLETLKDKTLSNIRERNIGHLLGLLSILLLLSAWKLYLGTLGLVFSGRGAVIGAGHTDVFVQYPANLVTIGLLVILAGWMSWYGIWRNKSLKDVSWRTLRIPIGVVIALIIVYGIWPAAHQGFIVSPSEFTKEKPFIKRNIKFTSMAYDLEGVESRRPDYKDGISEDKLEEHDKATENVRLWDWRAGLDAINQIQALRLYHSFNDLDVDRYKLDGELKEVMLSARELKKSELMKRSKNFVNRRVIYTHGYGASAFKVNDFTSGGRPNLLTKDMPVRSEYSNLEVARPQIYYGETNEDYVLANTSQEEFDYPKGNNNEYIHYQGKGGVDFNGFWRKLLFASKFGNLTMLLTKYSKKGTQLIFDRKIKERVKKIAPFLTLDEDPYLVITPNGKMKWVIDAYTTSGNYPYSEKYKESVFSTELEQGEQGRKSEVKFPERYEGINYIRNSVKIVVDAYQGTANFYTFEEGPIINSWEKIFPDMFTDKKDAPQWLMNHIRYPEDYLTIQSRLFGVYHMKNPKAFYQREDAWRIATEKFYQKSREVEPYYVITKLPSKENPEFAQIVPLTPKSEKNNLVGWTAGRCDGEHYGEFLAYKYPKGKLVYGPRQIEARIDQNTEMSQRFSLWSQRGSKVIRGNLLTIPIDDTMFYFEPVFLRAENSQIPELKKVIVAMGDSEVFWGNNLEKALNNLFAGRIPTETKQRVKETPGAKPVKDLIKSAVDAFSQYEKLTSEGKYEKAGKKLKQLKKNLKRLQQLSKEQKEGSKKS